MFEKYHVDETKGDVSLDEKYQRYNTYEKEYDLKQKEIERQKEELERQNNTNEYRRLQRKRQKEEKQRFKSNTSSSRSFANILLFFPRKIFLLFKYLFIGIYKLFFYLFKGIFLGFKYLGYGLYKAFSHAWKPILIGVGAVGIIGGIIALIVVNQRPTFYNINDGVFVVEPTCESKGLYRFVNETKKPFSKELVNYDFEIPESHTFDSTNTCTKCGKHLEFNRDILLYTKLNDGNGDYICIYSLLPCEDENCIIPPYIDGIPVKEVHLNVYNPYVGSKLGTLEEIPENMNDIIKNVYGKDKSKYIYVYSSGSEESIFYGNSENTENTESKYQTYIEKNVVYALGDFKDIVTEKYGLAGNIIMTGNVEHYVENFPLRFRFYESEIIRSTGLHSVNGENDNSIAYQLSGPIFIKDVKEYKINNIDTSKEDNNHLSFFVIPHGLELFSIPDEYSIYDMYLNYQSDYFNFKNGNLYSKDKTYINKGANLPDTNFEGELRTRESTYVVNKNINRYFDCYRVENGFRPDLVKTTHIKTVDDLKNKFSKAIEESFFDNQVIVLDNDLDFNGADIPNCSCIRGIFDGKGHTLRNGNDSVVFSSNGGLIKNLKFDNCTNVRLTDFNDGEINNVEITNSTYSINYPGEYYGIICCRNTGTALKNIRIKNCSINIDFTNHDYGTANYYFGVVCGLSDASKTDLNNIIVENNEVKFKCLADFINSNKPDTRLSIYVGGIFGYAENKNDTTNISNLLSINNKIEVNVPWQAANVYFEKKISVEIGGIIARVNNSTGRFLLDSMAIDNDIKGVVSGSSAEYYVTSSKIISEIANFSWFNESYIGEKEFNLYTNKVAEGHALIAQSQSVLILPETVEKYKIQIIDLNTFILPEHMVKNGWSIVDGNVSLSFVIEE